MNMFIFCAITEDIKLKAKHELFFSFAEQNKNRFFFQIVPLQTDLYFILILGTLSCKVNVLIGVWITYVASSSITDS